MQYHIVHRVVHENLTIQLRLAEDSK